VPACRRHLHRFYGAGAGHLFGVLVCVALAGGAVAIVAGDPAWPVMLAWFLAAVLLHDFLLFPLYAAGDRLLTATARVRSGRRRSHPSVPVVNHVRVPLLGAGLTFLLFLPGIIGQGEPALRAASGLDTAPVAGRWLLLVAGMAAVSALVYLLRVLRARPTSAHRTTESMSPDGETSTY
jgi:hypothetical protein